MTDRPHSPLLAELGKLVLSCLLALRDVLNERQLLFKPRHTLPSPELYAKGEELHAKDLHYSEDPYDAPLSAKLANYSFGTPSPRTPTALPTPKLPPASSHIRRRSSAKTPNLSVTLDLRGSTTATTRVHFPETSKLSSFQWPPTPPDEKGAWIAPEVARAVAEQEGWTRRRRMGVVAMLREDVFGGDWWKMAIPAVLFALQNNLM